MGSGRSTTMASSVASSSLKSATFAPAITTARGPPSASTKMERFTPFFPLSVGLGPTRSPKTSLAHCAVGGLPLEVHPTEFALLDETLPDEIQHVKLDPPLEGPVYRGVVGELFGQSVPPAAASHPEDDRLQSRAGPREAAGAFGADHARLGIASMISHNSSGTRQRGGCVHKTSVKAARKRRPPSSKMVGAQVNSRGGEDGPRQS